MTEIMIQQCSQWHLREKDLIINKLKSSEEKLLKNIKLNPKLWNNDCLSIAIDTKKTDPCNFGLSSSIKLNNPSDNARNTAKTVEYREEDESIDLTGKVR